MPLLRIKYKLILNNDCFMHFLFRLLIEDMYDSQGHRNIVHRTKQNYIAKFRRNEPGLFLQNFGRVQNFLRLT